MLELRHTLPGLLTGRGTRYPHHAMQPEATRRMLAVDDEPAILLALASFFYNRGWSVDRATTQAQAEELLQQGEYDAVLVDLWLTMSDAPTGLEVVDFARRQNHQGCIVVLSGHGTESARAAALAAGADQFVDKPTRLSLLEGIINDLLMR